jgi:hypothetical protein
MNWIDNDLFLSMLTDFMEEHNLSIEDIDIPHFIYGMSNLFDYPPDDRHRICETIASIYSKCFC